MRESTAEERRWATVVFADLAGYTSFTEQRDPEDVHAVVDPCLAMLADIVAHFGGFIMRVVGDEVMGVFGAPVAHEDDPERAVRAALAMQEQMAARSEQFGGLRLRVGVNTGEMLFAPVAGGAARQPTVTGDAVNTAARLQHAAPEGGVLVGDQTYRATGAVVEYEPVPPVRARGKTSPLGAWLARDVSARDMARGRSESTLLGRDAELDRLRSAWRQVTAGTPCLVTVTGDAGIGKTRLVDEFLRLVTAEGGRVLRGRALPYGGRTGYGALGEQLRRAAGVEAGDELADARARLDRLADRVLGGELAGADRAHLAALAGLSDDEAVADRHALWSFARRFVEALARERPTALIFEDLQWAESSMLDLLDLMAGRSTGVPLLLVAITRPELFAAQPGWGTAARHSVRLALEPLRPADAHALARQELGEEATAEHLDALVTRAGGNPLFIVELAAAVGERAAGTRVPPTIHGVIAARLDSLPVSARTVALSASVAGRSFDRATLEALRPEADVAADLAVLEERGLVLRETGGETFGFRHDLIREVAYGTLTRAARRRSHRTLARFFEGDGGIETAERAALLAHHCREAGESEAAVRYLVLAAEYALRSWASREAAAFYGEAATLVPEDDERRRKDLRLAGALALVDAGDYPAAAAALERLTAVLEGPARVEALIGWSRAKFWMMDTSTAQRVAQEAVERARALDDRALLARARAVQSLALSSLETRTLQGIAEGEAVAESWPADAPPGDRAALLAILAGYHYWAGNFASAVQRGRQGYELARELHRLDDLLLGGSHLALGLTGLGRHEEALEVCATCAAEGREHEAIPRFTARLLNMWANVLRELGDVEGSRDLNREAIELGTLAGFPPPVIQARIDLLFCDLAEGEFGRASSAWPALQEQAAAMRAWHNWLTIGRLAAARAEIALGLGDTREAAEGAVAAVDHARRIHRPKYEMSSLRVLGEAQLRLGEPASAVATLERSLQIARSLGHPPSIWRAAASVAEAAAAAGRDDRAESAGRLSESTLRAFVDTLAPSHRPGVLEVAAGR